MANKLKELLKKEVGNKGLIDILSVIRNLGASAASSDLPNPDVKKGAVAVKSVLDIVINVLNGNLDPDKIDLDNIFVKTPDQLLAEKGISQEEIDRILNK